MVIIGASQALDPGSIPGRRSGRGISSIGRVRALQARGTGIETPMLHFGLYACGCFGRFRSELFPSAFKLGWPSGLRRSTQVRVSPGGVGSNPTPSIEILFLRFGFSKLCVSTCWCNVGHWSSGMILL